MANAVHRYTTYTIPNTNRVVGVRYLLCTQEDIVVRQIAGSVRDSGYFGINGTFFNPETGYLTGIAINNGQVVKNYGAKNCEAPTNGNVTLKPRGAYFYFQNTVNNINGGTAVIGEYEGTSYDGITLHTNNVKFAIGGASLFTSETNLTKSEYIDRVGRLEGITHVDEPRARSAIVYIGGSISGLNTVLLTVYGLSNSPHTGGYNYATEDNAVTLWELRELINTVFSPMTPLGTGPIIHAIALDGGPSTQLAYKDGTVTRSFQAKIKKAGPDYGTYNRTVYTMLSVPM